MNVQSPDELISAALDGEVVDLEALQAALAQPGARETLAAFVLLRAAAAADGATPEAAPDATWLENARRPAAWRVLRGRVPVGVAASLVALAAAGSFYLGTARREPAATPPPPAVAQRAPDQAVPQPPPANIGNQVREQPPTPTRRVHFAPGEWRQGS